MNTNLPDLIDDLWDYGDPVASEQRFRAQLAEVAAGEDRWQLLTQVARAQGLQGQFAKASATLDEVAAHLPAGPTTAQVRYELERGRVLNSQGDRHAAVPCFEAALSLAESLGEQALAVDAAHMLAIAGPDDALAWNLRALATAEEAADPRARRWQGSLLNNIGWTYHAAGDIEQAFTYLHRARTFHREEGPERTYRIARWCVARVQRDLGQIEQALAEQRALEAEYATFNEPSGYVFEEIGECLALLGETAEAAPYFARAHELLVVDPWLVANEPDRLDRLQRLGEQAGR